MEQSGDKMKTDILQIKLHQILQKYKCKVIIPARRADQPLVFNKFAFCDNFILKELNTT